MESGIRTMMMQLSLNQEEASALKDALITYISDLRMEIADTDQQEFRENLKREEMLLSGILENLKK
jgi:glycine cleavage system regulatory protein